MDLNLTMDAAALAKTKYEVDAYNKSLGQRQASVNALGKDEFLKLLITQLQNQDPTEPVNDTEFIAQMAQFSSLEQMTNLTGEFARVANLLEAARAVSLLGKEVEIASGDAVTRGVVEEVTGAEYPQLLVNGTYWDYSSVQAIR